MEFQKFNEPKPPMFAGRIDVRPKKHFEIADQQAFDDVQKEVEQKVSKLIEKDPQIQKQQAQAAKSGTTPGTPTPGVQAQVNEQVAERQLKFLKEQVNLSKKAQQTQAQIKASRQVAKMFEGFNIVPREILAKAELTKKKSNFERIKDEDYVYYPDLLGAPFFDDKNAEEVAADIFDTRFFKAASQLPGEGNTIPHNLNLFYGMGSNPFKQGDQKNFNTFLTGSPYRSMHEQSMSPRAILQKLDPDFWSSMAAAIARIQNAQLSDEDAETLGLRASALADGNNDLNLKGVADPYSDNEIEAFDINANYHTVIMSELWRGWTDEQVFAFVNRAWEARTRFDDVLREVIGPATSQAKVIPSNQLAGPGKEMDEEEKAKATKNIDPEDLVALEEENLARTEQVLKKVDAWWDRVGSHLDEGTVLPYGLMSAMTPMVQSMMDWGHWGDQKAKKVDGESVKETGFREKLVNGYIGYVKHHYISQRFKGGSPLTADDLLLDNPQRAAFVLDELKKKGFIDDSGRIAGGFDGTNPNFALDIAVPESEKGLIRDALREAAVGKFSIAVQDKTVIEGKKRSDIRLKGPDGQSRTLMELVELVNKGNSPLEKIRNAHTAYEMFFDMHAAMTGLAQAGQSGDGQMQLTALGDKQVQVTVYAQGEWKQWHKPEQGEADQTQGWRDKTGALTVTFASAAEAREFKDSIRMMMALLEPVVGSFAPDATEQGKAVKLLVDNSGSTDAAEMITEGDVQYRMTVDTVFQKEYFQTKDWQTVSRFLEDKAIGTLRDRIFEKNAGNRLLRLDHKRKHRRYDERKEEHEQEEFQRIIREAKSRGAAKRKRRTERKAKKASREAEQQAALSRALSKKRAQTVKRANRQAQKQKKA